ncbi:MAG TPA: N-acetyltransferase [Vitreimonas sp.]|uniref:GNAT family N-acetyltransferase n=1 Tax=Vitreimonas sp. TaxID=3069702 RepID=UPI002D427B3B|nr:N-acetyltransferase [Vitreimonas sp.]HYD88662.1 N-acetyltransferase [Vitreimonas sp.]
MVRDATPNDYPAIRQIVRQAFGQEDEANLVDQLRAEGHVVVELVAASEIALQGHVLYSRLTIERPSGNLNAAALAPVSVLPAFQRGGIGKALIGAGNARCAALGCAAIIVLGHADYYPQFGFSAAAAESLEAPFSGPHFMALELRPDVLKAGGRVRYANAFGV